MSVTAASAHTPGGDGHGALVGAKIFIIGAGSGMGAAIAKGAVARGAKVALAGRSIGKLGKAAAELGDNVLGRYGLDLADRTALEAALAEHGPYDHMVSTAADLTFAPFVELTDEKINVMLASKFWGPINLARAAQEHLTQTGSVLFFSGVAAYRQGQGTSIVGALNMALESLTAGLAIETKPKRFNVISPGVVDTELWSGMNEEARTAFFDQIAAGLPAGRVGSVEDIAHAALSVLENGYINGTVVNIDGGGRIA